MRRKTKKMLAAQERIGNADLRGEIRRMVNEEGLAMIAIADRLGVSKATLGYWLLKLDIQVQRVAIYPGEQAVIVPVGKKIKHVIYEDTDRSWASDGSRAGTN